MTVESEAGANPASEQPLTPPQPVCSEPERSQSLGPRVVGIGASAGGLQAFTEFLQQMPADSGLAFVLIQHLDPQQPSYLEELLTVQTEMPVRQVSDPTPVVANHVYLIPPNTALTIEQGELHLEPPTAAHGHRLPIDHFFRSLAAEQGPRAVGIVLSGTGADGTEGLAAIQAGGGTTLVQEPTSTTHPEMPQAALTRGVVDHSLEIAAMPALLLNGTLPVVAASAPPLTDPMRLILALLQQATGHDFSRYKRTTLQRRIDRRMQILHLSSPAAYLAQLSQDRSEVDLLFQDLLIGVTEFFRDPEAFDALAPTVIPSLLRNKDAGAALRIWAPGCASGEEAYSLAMMLREQLVQLDAPPPVQIFATDIDEAALAIARLGWYDAGITRHVSPERLSRYFVNESGGYQVSKAIREMCLFSVHNLISDPPFGRMDLIVCRNLLIYFDTELQRQLIPVFHYALTAGGYLFLGSAESAVGAVDTSELFRVINGPYRIYQRRERLVRSQITLPWASTRRPTARISGVAPHPRIASPGDLGTAIEQILLHEYAPTTLAIDPQGAIIYLSGQAYPYLSVPSGVPSANLFDMAHPDLRLPLRAALRAATQTHTTVVREDQTLLIADKQMQVILTMRPFPEAGAEAGLFLVILQAYNTPANVLLTAGSPGFRAVPAEALAQELQRTRETLEATISELQEANLDLTAANEELRSLNEELQATNEELQTSKEEIQSINEELQTVNAELSRKIDELDRANADIANLFASAKIPAIFLHADGRISRFTPQATELFALIESDIGRPIADLKARFSHDDLHAQIAQVFRTLTPMEVVVRQIEQDRWWNLHLRPYLTLAKKADGVVLTFTDITSLKQAEAILQTSHDDLEHQVEARISELAQVNTALQAQIEEQLRGEQSRQHLIQQLVTAQEEERRHIARELHDQMGQDLASLILGLKVLKEGHPPDEPITKRITQLQAMALQISQAVRNLAVELRPSVLDDLGLELALSNYVEQWSAHARVGVDLHTSRLGAGVLPLAVETTIYRLVQEALTNVLKHAQASEVSVIIERHAGQMRVIIEDNGIGFDVTTAPQVLIGGQQLGLVGMRERVALLGGKLRIESDPGSGTSIFANLPLPTTIEGDHNGPDNGISR